MAITGFCNSAKAELIQGGHLFGAAVGPLSCSGVSGQFVLTGLPSTAGISSGMIAAGTGIGANRVVSTVDSPSQVTLSKTIAGTPTTVTFTADVFQIALVKAGPSLTYSATQTNIGTPGSGTPTTANLGTDEVSGAGYSSGGVALSANELALSGSVGIAGWTNNVSFTSATFSTTAGIIFNTTATHLGAAAAPLNKRTIGVIDFGGTQTVSAGTLTLLMPSFTSSTAIIQIN